MEKDESPIFKSKPYQKLLSYQRAEIVYLATYRFVERFLGKAIAHTIKWCRRRGAANRI